MLFTGMTLVVIVWLGSPAFGEEPAKPKLVIEFRWLEPHYIKGVTEEKGKPIVCGGKDWFVHSKPVLTGEHIVSATFKQIHFANLNQYGVAFTLDKTATKKLAEACGDAQGRLLTVYVNGDWYANSYFDSTKPEEFEPPLAGYTLSKELAERIIETIKQRK